MEVGPYHRLLVCLAIIFGVVLLEAGAADPACTLPNRQQGQCVNIKRCRNIRGIADNPPSTGLANWIRKAACNLPGVERSICCQPAEIDPEPAPVTQIQSDLLPKQCGKSLTERIAFGNATRVFAYPWMALLRYNINGEITDGCGGSLINERYVLTAAHCIKTPSTKPLHSVRLGEHTRNQEVDCNIFRNENGEEIDRDCADPVEDYNIESFHIHPDYNKPKFSNDLGLLRLDRTVVFKDHIQPICLPVTPQLQAKQFERYVVTGWGTTEFQTGSNVLLEAILPRVDIDECQQKMTENRLNVKLGPKQMCAGGSGKVDTCRGDSGGPLGFSTDYNGARFVQFGIVSAGVDSCGLKTVPGIYCRVGSYMDWITETLKP